MGYLISKEELVRRQSLPLEEKIRWCIEKYIDYVDNFKDVYLAFSGGKDSQVLRDIVHRLHKGEMDQYLFDEYRVLYKMIIKCKTPPPDVFCNTGLEFPEIVAHAKKISDELVVLKPKIGFVRFISEVGVAVGSKQIAMQIRRLKGYIQNPSPKNENTRRLYLDGIRSDGKYSPNSKLPNRWRPLLDAPFNVTDKCCDNFKKDPFKEYEKKTGRKPIIGTTAEESSQRTVSYMKTGCISFEEGKEKCRPISIFKKEDIWAYAELFGIRFCEVYYDRNIDVEGLDGKINKVFVEGESETGCTFCLFGIHLEPKSKPNRIERLKISHPKYYEAVVVKAGLGKVLEWIGVKY